MPKAPPPPKVVDRIQKLLRRASETSGSGRTERETAALEIVRLIEEHDIAIGPPAITISPRTAPSRRPAAASSPPAPAPPPPSSPIASWMTITVAQPTPCHFCGRLLRRGDRAVLFPDYPITVHDWPCKVAE